MEDREVVVWGGHVCCIVKYCNWHVMPQYYNGVCSKKGDSPCVYIKDCPAFAIVEVSTIICLPHYLGDYNQSQYISPAPAADFTGDGPSWGPLPSRDWVHTFRPAGWAHHRRGFRGAGSWTRNQAAHPQSTGTGKGMLWAWSDLLHQKLAAECIPSGYMSHAHLRIAYTKPGMVMQAN